MTELVLAIVAGVVTIAAPCILPMLPILFGAGLQGGSRTRPLWIVTGFVATFALMALVLGRMTAALGMAPETLRTGALLMLAGFGALMIWPAPFAAVTIRLGAVFRRADALASAGGDGNVGGLVLGALIGVLWTPCAGPVLGSILTLVASAEDARRAAVLLVGYALGAAVPMLLIAYGGQHAMTRIRRLAPHTGTLQRAFGALVIASALAMHAGWDTTLGARLAGAFAATEPGAASDPRTTSVLDDDGPAPELVGVTAWLNSDPLTLRALRGKVVLVDFWTFGCGNCVATLPYVETWWTRYRDRGLVVIGVHTPEFPHEQSITSLRAALARHGLTYPVAQDNAYATWKAYDNRYWPAQYLIDQRGHLVLSHFGEGHYAEMERAIATLLNEAPRT